MNKAKLLDLKNLIKTKDAVGEGNIKIVDTKLGWIQGVLIPCLLNIWGVMLFLRMSWIVGQAGIGLSLFIIAISSCVCVITTLSLSAICTNGEVKGGGIYYLISRSLGPEFGGSVGVVFAFANAVAASMNTIGFCDSLNDLLKSHKMRIIDNSHTDVRIVGTLILIILCLVCAVGIDFESKLQNFLMVVIVIALIDYGMGSLAGPINNVEIAQGYVGINSYTFMENLRPNFRPAEGQDHNFFSVFAIYFPSVTGVQAGANICGDLKDAASSIPRGTLLALLISTLSYVGMVVTSGASVMRDASGSVSDPVVSAIKSGNYEMKPKCFYTKEGCPYGLHNSYRVSELVSLWAPLIYVGCWAATLSTALTNLLSVPRLIQALGEDRIYPKLIFFSQGYGKHNEPYRGYVLVFVVSLVFVLIADLNRIAPLISNFYLASYALINFCTFHAALVHPLGWRPSFPYYNQWVSLAGFFMCGAIMLLISWFMFVVTIAIFFTLYLLVTYKRPNVNWGSSTQAQQYLRALSAAYSLARTSEHAKTYFPQLLVLAGQPHIRPTLVDLGSLITSGGNSLMIIGDICERQLSYSEHLERKREADEWLLSRKMRAFYTIMNGFDFETGARALMQSAGVGRLAPNIVLMGFKTNWTNDSPTTLESYYNVLHTAFQNRLAIAIVRVGQGLAWGYGTTVIQPIEGDMSELQNLMYINSDLDLAQKPISTNVSPETKKNDTEKKRKSSRTSDEQKLPQEQVFQISVFHIKQGEGPVDVWWLYDDGGLTVLLPYIIAKRSIWAVCNLRLFVLGAFDNEEDKNKMIDLFSKLRVQYSSLTLIPDIRSPPLGETNKLFEETIQKFMKENPGYTGITNSEVEKLADKTNRQLRLREMMLDNSLHARLIVISLLIPKKGSVSPAMYMAWLDMLSRDLPPVLFVRGNDKNVLTLFT